MTQSRYAVFDFDGVLLRGDSFAGYLRWRVQQKRSRLLRALPLAPLLPLLRHPRSLPWAAGRFARALTRDLDQAQFEREIDAFSEVWLSRPDRAITPLLARLRAHQDQGEHVVVVSGTAQFLLDTLLHRLDVRDALALGSQLRFDHGLQVQRHNFGATKLKTLAEAGLPPRWQTCYSDSAADLPILAAAEHAVLVAPRPDDEQRLRAALTGSVELVRL